MALDDWRMREMEKAEERVLKTIGAILDDSKGGLSGGELDDIKDCMSILLMMKKCQHMDKGNTLPGIHK